MSKTMYPGADATIQNFQKVDPGATMVANCLLLHTTEGMGFPSTATYKNGADAPTLTAFPNIAEKKLEWRQHFPINKSARALENRPGGVETNTLGVVQIELVGTCDDTHKTSWKVSGKTYRAGVDYIHWPTAPDWCWAELAKFVAWMHEQSPKFQIKDGAPRGWPPYPRTAAQEKAARMTFAEWEACYAIVGHSLAPEQSHGDPGAIAVGIKKLIAYATGTTVPADPPVDPPVTPPVAKPKTAVWGKPATWVLGATGADATKLGERIVIWSKALGLPAPYKVGPGPEFTETDRAALSKVQVAFGYGKTAADLAKGGNSDGYPGAQTFKDLAADPKPKPKSQPVWGKPGTWKVGGVSADVKRLAQRLVAHGFGRFYANGVDKTFTAGEDKKAVQAFQKAQGWKGNDADGFPGTETMKLLAAPAPLPKAMDRMFHVPDGTWYAIENSIPGLEYAESKGYPWVDMDCHITKEGTWVFGHDTSPSDDHFIITPQMKKKYGPKPNIENMTWEDLQTLRTPPVKWQSKSITLRYYSADEVMTWLSSHPKMSVSLEMKQSAAFEHPATLKAMHDLAVKHGVDPKRLAVMSIARPAYNHLARFKAAHAYFKTIVLPHDLAKPSGWSKVEPYVDYCRGSWK